MIIYNLRSLMHQKAIETGEKLTYADIEKQTGISRPTLTRIGSRKGFNVGIEVIEKLCLFFQCTCDQLVTFMPDEMMPQNKNT